MENYHDTLDNTLDILTLDPLRWGPYTWFNPTPTVSLFSLLSQIQSCPFPHIRRLVILSTTSLQNIKDYISNLLGPIPKFTYSTLFFFPVESIPITHRWPSCASNPTALNKNPMFLHVLDNLADPPHPYSATNLSSHLTSFIHTTSSPDSSFHFSPSNPDHYIPHPVPVPLTVSSNIPSILAPPDNLPSSATNFPLIDVPVISTFSPPDPPSLICKAPYTWLLHPRPHHTTHPYLSWYRHLPLRYLSRDEALLPTHYTLSSLLNLSPHIILRSFQTNGLPEYALNPSTLKAVHKHTLASLLTIYRRVESWRRRKKG